MRTRALSRVDSGQLTRKRRLRLAGAQARAAPGRAAGGAQGGETKRIERRKVNEINKMRGKSGLPFSLLRLCPAVTL
jgi:hypothetical protein